MAQHTLQYKGYTATIEPSTEDGVLYGKVTGIKDLIAFEGSTIAEIKRMFECAIGEYLADCLVAGRVPDQPKGE